MTAQTPSVAAVVVSFNTCEATLACLESLHRCSGLMETVVVDNASGDGTTDAIRNRFPRVRLIENDTNLGFSAACNRGWLATRGDSILFLNSDARLEPDAPLRLVAILASESLVGVVGPRIVDGSGKIEVSTGRDLSILSELRQRRLVAGVAAGKPGLVAEAAALHSRERFVDWVSGACLLARRTMLEAVGGFDEQFFLYEEDADLCLRARGAGWRVLFTPAVTVVHERGASMSRAPALARMAYHRSHLRYYRRHRGSVSCLLLRGLFIGKSLMAWAGGRRAEALGLWRLALSHGLV